MATFEIGIVPVMEAADPTVAGVVKIFVEASGGIGIVPIQYILVDEAGVVPVETVLAMDVGVVPVVDLS